jgi:hypothetical protein
VVESIKVACPLLPFCFRLTRLPRFGAGTASTLTEVSRQDCEEYEGENEKQNDQDAHDEEPLSLEEVMLRLVRHERAILLAVPIMLPLF